MNINLARVFSFAANDFLRSRGMSVAAIFILTLTTLLVTVLFFIGGMSNYLISTIENKVDITAYFKESTEDKTIEGIKDELLEQLPQIKSIEFVSKDDALAIFMERHRDNKTIADAITEVGVNPFLPSLNIITKDPSQYEEIAAILGSPEFATLIEGVDFSQKKATIDKIFSTTKTINWTGMGVGLVMVIMAVLVVFNTVKLIIDRSKDEIATMKIVGASNWFVKAPFIIEGGMFGLVAFGFSLLVTIFATMSLSYFVALILPGFNLFGFFVANFFMIILIQLLAGVGLGVFASFIVVKKYLKV